MDKDKTLNLYGIEIIVEYSDNQLESSLSSLSQLFCSIPNNPFRGKDSSPLYLKFSNSTISIPDGCKLISDKQSLLRLHQLDEFVYISYKKSMLQIDFTNETVMGHFEESVFKFPRMISHAFILTAIVMLLHSRKLFYLHAAALENAGNGYLFVGQSGSGKSTNTMHLVESGWNYLSDDIVLLQQKENKEISVHSFPGDFKFNDNFINQPSKDYLKEHIYDVPFNEKKHIDIQKIYPNQFVQYSTPNTVIFPQIVDEPTTRLVPTTHINALTNLLQQSPYIFLPHRFKQLHLDVLKDLIKQSDCYLLLSGKDLLNNPGKLSKIIEAVLNNNVKEDSLCGN